MSDKIEKTVSKKDNEQKEIEYEIYLASSQDENGNDFQTNKPLKTFEEWLKTN